MIDKVTSAEKVQKEYIKGGKSEGMSVSQIAEKHGVEVAVIEAQIVKGIKIEHEHSPEDVVAAEISRDHLFEHPYYYDYLEKMEKEFEKDYEAKGYGKKKNKGKPTSMEGQAVQDSIPADEKIKLRLKALFG
jgi:hypothetical protein